jgi:hypothetical protein
MCKVHTSNTIRAKAPKPAADQVQP